MNSNQKIVVGTLGAALAGAAAGVLFAPKKGTDTRNMIKTKANDLTNSTKQSLTKSYEKSKSAITGLTDKVKNGFRMNGNGSSASTQQDQKSLSDTTQKSYASNRGNSGTSTNSTPAMAGAGTPSKSTSNFDTTTKKFDGTV